MGKVAEIGKAISERVGKMDTVTIGSFITGGLMLIGGIIITIAGMKNEDPIEVENLASGSDVNEPNDVVAEEAAPVEEDKTE